MKRKRRGREGGREGDSEFKSWDPWSGNHSNALIETNITEQNSPERWVVLERVGL